MKKKNLYTITILRNMGAPISWTIRARTLIFVALVALIGGLINMVGIVDYLSLYSQVKILNQELHLTQGKMIELDKHLNQIDSYRIEKEKDNPLKDGSLEVGLLTQNPFSTKGIWISQSENKTLAAEGMRLEVTKTHVALKRDELRFIIRLENYSNPPEDVGGYVCLTLVNKDVTPATYKSATGGSLGNDGFPSSYKSGVQYFSAPGKMSRVKLNYKLKEDDEFYTHMMVFAYSYKGALLTKKTLPLKKDIFFE